jgi:hypothetical protein
MRKLSTWHGLGNMMQLPATPTGRLRLRSWQLSRLYHSSERCVVEVMSQHLSNDRGKMPIKAYLAQAVYSDTGTSVMTHFHDILGHRQLQRLHPPPGHSTDPSDYASTTTCRDDPSPVFSCPVPLPTPSAVHHPLSTRPLQERTSSKTIPALCHYRTPHRCTHKPERHAPT